MAIIPPIQPSVSPTLNAGDDYQRIDATPAAFGAQIGQAEQGLGQAGEQMGNTLAQQAIVQQGLKNEMYARDQGVVTMQKMADESNTFHSLSGNAANEYYPTYQANLAKIHQEAIQAAPNPMAQKMLADQSSFLMSQLIRSGSAYNADQFKVAQKTSLIGDAGAKTQFAVNNQNDPLIVAGAANAVADSAAKLADIDGVDPQTKAMQVAAAKGNFYHTLLADMMIRNPSQAASLFNSVRDQLDAGSQLRIDEMLRPKVQGAAADGWVQQHMGGGAVGSSDLYGAIAGVESNNGADPSTSVDGARGKFQIMPGTFQQYAKAGENIDTPADNEAVGHRIIDDYSGKYQGDAARVAVAYFSGPGNVAPAGSATPWKEDKRDGYGQTTSGYVSKVLSRMNGSGQGGQSAVGNYPDEGALVQQAVKDFPDDPEMQRAVISRIGEKMRLMNIQGAAERSAIQKQYGDALSALEAGKDDISIPADRIHALFPAPVANDMLEKLDVAKVSGQVFKSVQWSSPDDLASARQDLSTGQGPLSGLLKQKMGGPTGVASSDPAAAGAETPEQFGMRQRMLSKFDAMVVQRNEALTKDPAGYAASSPPVASAMKALNPGDPQTGQAYAAATLGVQAQLGVPENARHILTLGQAQGMAQKLMQTDPTQGDIGPVLTKTLASYGTAANQVWGDLINLGKLPPDYMILANMPDPGARGDFQRMLATVKEKGGVEALKTAAGKANVQTIDQGIDDQMADFQKSAGLPGLGGDAMLTSRIASGVQRLAYYHTMQGMDAGDALKSAYNQVIGDRYDFDGTMRTPKGMMPLAQTITGNMQAGLKPEDVAPMASPGVGLTPEQRQQVTVDAAKRGVWFPTEDDQGLMLVGRLKNGQYVPIMRPDGTRVQARFADMKRDGAPAPVLPSGQGADLAMTP